MEYNHLIVGELPTEPSILILSRWDGQRAKVFPSKRSKTTRGAIIFKPEEIPAELAEIDRIIADGTRRSTFRADFVAPDQAQAFIDALVLEIERARTIDVMPRGFSDKEMEKMGLKPQTEAL